MSHAILILNGHPDATGKGLCYALAEAYAEGAREAGHTVDRIDVGALDFTFLGSQAQFERGMTPPTIVDAQERIRRADHLVVIFPLWLGDIPARLKGFFEQTLRPGFAFTQRPNGLPIRHLKGRSARVIVTMGMPAFVYRWYFWAHGLKNLERNILGFVGIAPVRDIIVGSLANGNRDAIRRRLDAVRELGRRGL